MMLVICRRVRAPSSSCISQDQPGEQWTMFFKDPSGNNLEFKAMTKPDNLFAKYNVDEFDYGAGGDGDDVDAGQKEL